MKTNILPNETITAAVMELNFAMINTVSPLANTPHVFSKKFERKMRRLIRRVDYPGSYIALRAIACISIVLLLSFTIVITISPTARASVIKWIKEYCGPYIEYIIPQSQKNNLPDYHISALPEEYTELNRTNTGETCFVEYVNPHGQRIHLIYSNNPESGSLFVIGEDAVSVETSISGFSADLFIPTDPGEKLGIVWHDTNRQILFYISAQITQDDLVNYAKSIK